jgi:hypothetical protein
MDVPRRCRVSVQSGLAKLAVMRNLVPHFFEVQSHKTQQVDAAY